MLGAILFCKALYHFAIVNGDFKTMCFSVDRGIGFLNILSIGAFLFIPRASQLIHTPLVFPKDGQIG